MSKPGLCYRRLRKDEKRREIKNETTGKTRWTGKERKTIRKINKTTRKTRKINQNRVKCNGQLCYLMTLSSCLCFAVWKQFSSSFRCCMSSVSVSPGKSFVDWRSLVYVRWQHLHIISRFWWLILQRCSTRRHPRKSIFWGNPHHVSECNSGASKKLSGAAKEVDNNHLHISLDCAYAGMLKETAEQHGVRLTGETVFVCSMFDGQGVPDANSTSYDSAR